MSDTNIDSPVTSDAGTTEEVAGRRERTWRYTRLSLVLLGALLAGVIVTTVTVDLGPALRVQAEQAGSRQIGRPVHIGKLSIYLFLGRFLVEDLVIEGITPYDRPFLRAERIVVSMPWSALFRREVLFDSIEMTDWQMVIESFPGDRHTFPSLTGGSSESPDEPAGEKRFVTTLQYVRAHRGELTYEDHAAPWSAVARNIDVTVTKIHGYRGHARFSDGSVRIGSFEPMSAAMEADFDVEDGKIIFDRIDLDTDGAHSRLTGVVDVQQWPEQLYQVRSQLDFPILRDIFFGNDPFTVAGTGEFVGTYHLYKNGRDVEGEFSSGLATISGQPLPDLRGTLEWRRDRFEIFEATSALHGGTLDFSYSMAPLGAPEPGGARLETRYTNVDLAELTDFREIDGIRLRGRATGRNSLRWPIGRFAEREGEGRLTVSPPPGIAVQGPSVSAGRRSTAASTGDASSADESSVAHLPLGGQITYTLAPDAIELAPGSHLATPQTYVAFEGRTDYGAASRIPFHVTSSDWQESDRILAGIFTAFGRPTRVVRIDGDGGFDGVMLGQLSSPRVEGRFAADRLRLWDVNWGTWRGDVAIEGGYVDITNGLATKGAAALDMNGRFAFSTPRRDGGDEINARFSVAAWPVVDFRTAFGQVVYKVDGLFTGEFHLYGRYTSPFGFGRMTINDAVAYGEPFTSATAGLRFEGGGVRLDGIELVKEGGVITGAAYVEWDGTYAFNGDGRRIPMEAVAAVSTERAPLSGVLQFTASGVGAFASPQYDVRGRIDDLFVLDEGIGQVTGRIGVRNGEATLEVEAASPRLAISLSGRVALTREADAELTLRFTDTSLDPYVRAFEPRLLPFTTAVASGALRAVGELGNLEHLLVDGTVEQLQLALFDYQVRNEGPIRIALDQEVVRVERMHLIGEGTALDLTGEIMLRDDRIAVRATGDANLGILQGFFRDIRSSGNAEIVADIRGALRAPVLTGFAAVTDGRIRHFSLPHSLETANGRITFDLDGVHLDDLTATLGGGPVQFGGRIGLDGYRPGDVNVSMVGTDMQLRYPEGFRSVIDANLVLQGEFEDPLLAGIVSVADAVWVERFEADTNLLDFTGGGDVADVATDAPAFPMRFNVRIVAPGTLRIEDKNTRVVSSAELTVRGTARQPQLFGHVEIDRGEVFFEGNRYVVTRGSLDFTNPTSIDPFFDVEAETSVRVPGQIYRVIFHAAGTADRFVPELSSDPPLPAIDILSLLFGNVRDPADGELRAIRAADETEERLIEARAAQLLTSPLSSGVGRVVEESFGVDTFQITPSLSDESARQTAQLTPTARLTIGKRVTERAYLTFSRALTGVQRDLLILLEFDQSDRLSWILSQNEDQTYAIDFRVRHVF